MPDKKIKRCPFCGNVATLVVKDWDNKSDEYKVQCTHCETSQNQYYYDANEAIDHWNNRMKDMDIDIFEKIKVKHYNRKYDDETRLKIKSMREAGLKPREISEELNIPVRSVYFVRTSFMVGPLKR